MELSYILWRLADVSTPGRAQKLALATAFLALRLGTRRKDVVVGSRRVRPEAGNVRELGCVVAGQNVRRDDLRAALIAEHDTCEKMSPMRVVRLWEFASRRLALYVSQGWTAPTSYATSAFPTTLAKRHFEISNESRDAAHPDQVAIRILPATSSLPRSSLLNVTRRQLGQLALVKQQRERNADPNGRYQRLIRPSEFVDW